MNKDHQITCQQIEARLNELKDEYNKGRTRLRQLEDELTSLRETTLRISGAIIVLQELLPTSASITQPDDGQAAGPRRGTRGSEALTLDEKEN